MKRIYIRDAEQISLQQPLSEEWMSAPVYCREPYARAVDPDFRLWLSPAESRRLGRILKRALVIGRVIADKTGIGTPTPSSSARGWVAWRIRSASSSRCAAMASRC